MARRSPRSLGCLTALLLLAAAPAAQGAIRYASPSGSPAGACTDPIGACELEYAVETAANSGDEVVVLPGTHVLGPENDDRVRIDAKRLDLHGQEGQPRPRIFRSPGPNALGAIEVINGVPGTRIAHLEIEAPSSGVNVRRAPGLSVLEDLVVVGTDCGFCAGGGAVVLGGGWLLRDSVVRMLQEVGAGVLAGDGDSYVLNVTAFGTHPEGSGLSVRDELVPCFAVDPATVTARNTIARGGQHDLRVVHLCGSEASATLAIDHSNFRSDRVSLFGPSAAVDSSLGGNQTSLTPLFANEPLGNFHQISGSPTIDAGAFDPLLGATDFDGQPRVQGCAPDIGADELPAAPCPSPGGGGGGQPAGPAGPPAEPAVDSPPQLRALRLKPRRFAVARRGGSASAARRARVSYRLSESARIRFSVQRRALGRRAGGRCAKPKPGNRGRRRCVRWVRQRGSFSRRGRQGANSFLFNGRLRGRRLSPGRYRLVGVPTDPAGNRGKARRAGFAIVRR